MTLPVLMYHQICSDTTKDVSEFIVLQQVFRQQMLYLYEHGYVTPSLTDAFSDEPVGGKPVVITFDDGYMNNYQFAFPILQEFGFRAHISLIGDQSIRTNLWDREKGIPQAELMRVEHIEEMAANGMEFGSHSHTHKSLPSLAQDELEEELAISKESVERIIGRPTEFIAYPYGDVDDRVKRAVRNAGYKFAFATHTGPLDFHADAYEIRRILVENRSDTRYLYSKFSGINKTYMWGKWFAKTLLGKRNKFQYELSGKSHHHQKEHVG